MRTEAVSQYIVEWLIQRLESSKAQGFVVGVSGGIDSAVTSTLCAKTGFPVIVLNMPIHQEPTQHNRAIEQSEWLMNSFDNVQATTIDLTDSFEEIKKIEFEQVGKLDDLSYVNMASRLRMLTLYMISNSNNYLVAGTGNKVEDYGIGFFTKYGDGGVDISPIADLLKSQVYNIASYFGIPNSIQKATPTDGLWEDNRTDEDQIGASYDELEWALEAYDEGNTDNLTNRQKEVMGIYSRRHISTKHKLETPPVCIIPNDLLDNKGSES